MDTTNGQNNNGTTINNSPSGSSSKPPPWVWVLVALASALTLGILLYGGLICIRNRRSKRHQLGDGPADDNNVATRGGGPSSPRRPWDRRRRRSRSQPGASRWPWAHPSQRASTQSSEGLNELGEAPPPYNEDDLEPCLNVSMVEVNTGLGLGGGPSRVASRQDRGSRLDMDLESQQHEVHPQPPTYDFAVNLGTSETATAASSSSSSSSSTVQPPPPAIVVSEDRSTRVEQD
ncbi:hypothetical protein KVR01_001178 [Diaporthe batatas]|uniref:uncharacterized protein n=1 Tax=Diaporthe batatas TaxID=748121 RepID=UPI001D05135D|nr:uncharacterized protein KVR01_001178 [Diaporthe batatas]KAG8168429.1 hypothetical protein KVR01_001178 [Diaporthe batatas]